MQKQYRREVRVELSKHTSWKMFRYRRALVSVLFLRTNDSSREYSRNSEREGVCVGGSVCVTCVCIQETHVTLNPWHAAHTAPEGGQRSHGKRLSPDREIKHTQTCQADGSSNTHCWGACVYCMLTWVWHVFLTQVGNQCKTLCVCVCVLLMLLIFHLIFDLISLLQSNMSGVEVTGTVLPPHGQMTEDDRLRGNSQVYREIQGIWKG